MYYSLMNSNKSRIVIILPSIGIGGAENFVNRLMRHLCKDISFLLIILKDVDKEIVITKSKNIEVIRLRLFQSFNPAHFIRQAWFARRTIFSFRPIAVQCFLYPSELFSVILGRKLSIYWSVRGTGNPLEKSLLKRILIKLNILFANFFPKKIVACSEAAKEWAVSEGVNPSKILVIHNFLEDWTEVHQSKSKLLRDLSTNRNIRIKVGMAARIDPHKGHQPLMRAVINTVEVLGIPMTLSFIGTGTDKICLPKTITSRKAFIDGDFVIELLGPIIEDQEKACWFSNLDIYVMASQNLEGFPNALFEAIAIGCPYISSISGNVSEFLNPKYLYPTPTSDFITSRLLLLMSTPTKELKNDILESQSQLQVRASRLAVCSSYKNLWLY
jgi:glycosyltransferase involved in cell wall biosynthesis